MRLLVIGAGIVCASLICISILINTIGSALRQAQASQPPVVTIEVRAEAENDNSLNGMPAPRPSVQRRQSDLRFDNCPSSTTPNMPGTEQAPQAQPQSSNGAAPAGNQSAQPNPDNGRLSSRWGLGGAGCCGAGNMVPTSRAQLILPTSLRLLCQKAVRTEQPLQEANWHSRYSRPSSAWSRVRYREVASGNSVVRGVAEAWVAVDNILPPFRHTNNSSCWPSSPRTRSRSHFGPK